MFDSQDSLYTKFYIPSWAPKSCNTCQLSTKLPQASNLGMKSYRRCLRAPFYLEISVKNCCFITMCKAHSKVTNIKQQKYVKNSVLYLYPGRFRWLTYFCCFIFVTLLWALSYFALTARPQLTDTLYILCDILIVCTLRLNRKRRWLLGNLIPRS